MGEPMSEVRPCRFTNKWGHSYKINVEKRADDHDSPIVCLALGEMRSVGCFYADAWAHLTPAQARELAEELEDAAREAERGK